MPTDLACKPFLLSRVEDFLIPSVNSGFKFAELEISKHIPATLSEVNADSLHRNSPYCFAIATPIFSLRKRNRLGVRHSIQPNHQRVIAATTNAADG